MTSGPTLRARPGGRPEELWAHMWDAYGAFVWAAGFAGALAGVAPPAQAR